VFHHRDPFTTIGIVLSVLYEAIRFFRSRPASPIFCSGSKWSPQMAIRADQVGFRGLRRHPAVRRHPADLGHRHAGGGADRPDVRDLSVRICQPAVAPMPSRLLEILAGIPTVVYGFFAALTMAPAIRRRRRVDGTQVASESALAAGLVMGIMIIPVSSLSDDVINAVPQSLRDGAYAWARPAPRPSCRCHPAGSLPGIVGGILLAVSRAIGETMIVVMAAGLAANLTANPLDSVTTVTVQIVTLLVGDQEFDSAKTLAAFALGLTLFIITLGLNVIALAYRAQVREQYE
jgi:phosphate transport system permease protein